MQRRSQRTKTVPTKYDDFITLHSETNKKRRLNEQHEQSHKVRNTKSNLTRNRTTIKTANKLRTKQSIQKDNTKRSPQQIQK